MFVIHHEYIIKSLDIYLEIGVAAEFVVLDTIISGLTVPINNYEYNQFKIIIYNYHFCILYKKTICISFLKL